jgi:diguanylate cyclase (GGDEF)-like protein
MSNISRRGLTIKYLFALALVGILLASSYLLTYNLIENNQNSAATINVSGRQRMFSQRIALLGTEMANEKDPARKAWLKSQFVNDLLSMETISNKLLYTEIYIKDHGPVEHDESLSQQQIADQLDRFFSEAEAFAMTADEDAVFSNPHLRYIVEESTGNLLKNVDFLVLEHQLEGEQEVATLQLFAKGTLIAGVFLLVLIGVFVFRPMVAKIIEEKELLEDLNEKLVRLSIIDGLTGIPNRRNFDDYFPQEWKRAIREKSSISLIMCDIDHFKIYNDTYGHIEGDECLRRVAAVLAEALKRPADMVARYGGEEFVVILPNTDLKGAMAIAEVLRSVVEAENIEHINSKVSNRVTISLGVASVVPGESLDSEALLECADQALYMAKESGRNRVSYLNSCCLEVKE